MRGRGKERMTGVFFLEVARDSFEIMEFLVEIFYVFLVIDFGR